MRIKILQERKEGSYGASNIMVLALATLYSSPETDLITEYRKQRTRPTMFMKHCVETLPVDNSAQQTLRTLCPTTKRIKLYVSEWGKRGASHYVILHRTDNNLFRLACPRLLKYTPRKDSAIDGVFITWPSNNPEVACGQRAIIERLYIAGASVGNEIFDSPELQRELRLAVNVAQLFNSKTEVSVWGHPGKTVFDVSEAGIVLVRTRPHAPLPNKFNVVVWGDVSSNAVPDACDMPRHIIPQIKGTTPYRASDAVETNMLRWALDSRLLPYIAIAHTTTRGDIYTLCYDPETDDTYITQLATNRKILGLPRVIRQGKCYTPDLMLAEQIKKLYFDTSVGETAHRKHVYQLGNLLRTMGCTTFEDIQDAFADWGVPITPEEDELFEIIKAEAV